jgi:antitoxin MazE
VIEKKTRSHPTLEELLAKVTPENIHPEMDWGPPVGREFW